MKKIFMVLGILFSALFLILAVTIGVMMIYGQKYDQTSKDYAEKVVMEIGKDWNADTILKESSSNLVDVYNKDPQKFKTLLAWFAAKLGPVQKFDPKGDSNMSYLFDKGLSITAAYSGDAEFEKGKGQVSVRLVYSDEQWKISDLHVNSDQLLPMGQTK